MQNAFFFHVQFNIYFVAIFSTTWQAMLDNSAGGIKCAFKAAYLQQAPFIETCLQLPVYRSLVYEHALLSTPLSPALRFANRYCRCINAVSLDSNDCNYFYILLYLEFRTGEDYLNP